jgi:acetyl/propionyl-CoA carboxylase alpha subunit
MIAQVIAHGPNRAATIERLLGYLERVRITGIATNIPLLKRVLADQVFRKGEYDTNYLPQLLARIDAQALIGEIRRDAGAPAQGIDRETIKIEGSDELKVLSPATGIFYITPSPTEPEFVSVGQKIGVADTLCQLEAMKIFTPLSLKDFNTGDQELYPSVQEYEVTRINVSTGQQVNQGDLLFVLRAA